MRDVLYLRPNGKRSEWMELRYDHERFFLFTVPDDKHGGILTSERQLLGTCAGNIQKLNAFLALQDRSLGLTESERTRIQAYCTNRKIPAAPKAKRVRRSAKPESSPAYPTKLSGKRSRERGRVAPEQTQVRDIALTLAPRANRLN
jgi:hypothetical protein